LPSIVYNPDHQNTQINTTSELDYMTSLISDTRGGFRWSTGRFIKDIPGNLDMLDITSAEAASAILRVKVAPSKRSTLEHA
jgi:hypothetical protein